MVSINTLKTLSPEEIAKMSRTNLAKIVSQMASAANKRLKRLEKSYMGTESSSYIKAMKVGKFSVKGKTQGQLQNEFKRVRAFLSSSTSTVSGWKSIRQRTYKRIGGGFSDESAEKAFWRAYREIAQSEKALHNSYGSTETQRFLRSELRKSKQLSDEEIKKYNDLFPGDNLPTGNLSPVELAVARTLIEIGEDYERKEGDINDDFFKIEY